MDRIRNSPPMHYSPPPQQPPETPISEEQPPSSPLRNRSISVLNSRNSQETRRSDTPTPQWPFLFPEWEAYRTHGASLFDFNVPTPLPMVYADWISSNNSTLSAPLSHPRSIPESLSQGPQHSDDPTLYVSTESSSSESSNVSSNEEDELSILNNTAFEEGCQSLYDSDEELAGSAPNYNLYLSSPLISRKIETN